MAKFVYTDARVFAGAADLSAASNKVELTAEREAKDVTNFRSQGWKEFVAGLGSAQVKAEGFWEAGDDTKVDDAAWSMLGGNGPWSVCPADATDGAVVYFTKALKSNYVLLGSVGDVAPFKSDAQSSWPLVRGVVGNPPGTPRTTTGTGTAFDLGAVADGQAIYANVHVLSVSGTTPSITFRVESDDNSGFASAITRITFDAATDVGGQSARAIGPFTDTYWRVGWTVSGTAPSFLALVTLGIA